MWSLLTTHRELIRNLVSRELKSRYKGSALGFAWTLISPLILALIYVVFMTQLVAKGYGRPESIIVGVFAWQFTAVCINNGMLCITGNANLVKKVNFPRETIPLSVTISGWVDFLFMLAMELVIFLIWFAVGGDVIEKAPSPWAEIPRAVAWGWLWLLPIVVAVHFIFNLGIALLLSSLNVHYRDTQHLVGVASTGLFFLSPAMYDLSLITSLEKLPVWIERIYMLNPLAPIFTAYRTALLGHPYPWDNIWLWGGVLIGLLFPVFAYLVFRRLERNMADLL